MLVQLVKRYSQCSAVFSDFRNRARDAEERTASKQDCHHTSQPFYGLFFRDHPGEPVPEENFWTLWCKGD